MTFTPKAAVEACDIKRKKFRALGTAEEALVVAFLCSCFSGKKAISTKCALDEFATKRHLQSAGTCTRK